MLLSNKLQRCEVHSVALITLCGGIISQLRRGHSRRLDPLPVGRATSAGGSWAGQFGRNDDDVLQKMIYEDEIIDKGSRSLFLPGYDFWDFERVMQRREKDVQLQLRENRLHQAEYGSGTNGLGDVWNSLERDLNKSHLGNWSVTKQRMIKSAQRERQQEYAHFNVTPAERLAQQYQVRQEKKEKKLILIARRDAQLMKKNREKRDEVLRLKCAMKEEEDDKREQVRHIRLEILQSRESRKMRMEEENCRRIIDSHLRAESGKYSLALEGVYDEEKNRLIKQEKDLRKTQKQFFTSKHQSDLRRRCDVIRRDRRDYKYKEGARRDDLEQHLKKRKGDLAQERQDTKHKKKQAADVISMLRQNQVTGMRKKKDNLLSVFIKYFYLFDMN